MTIAQHQSESTEYMTPVLIVEAARELMGGIDLDPASSWLANKEIKATTYYGCRPRLFVDGLAEQWSGRVLLNPPGSRAPAGSISSSSAVVWWHKLACHWRDGDVEQAIFIGFNLEILRSTQGLDCPQPLDLPFCVPSRRISFDRPSKVSVDTGWPVRGATRVETKHPSHPNVLIYLPPRPVVDEKAALFVDLFKQFGGVSPW